MAAQKGEEASRAIFAGCYGYAVFALVSVPSLLVINFKLAGAQYENLGLSIPFDRDGDLVFVAKALKNLCCLLRIG